MRRTPRRNFNLSQQKRGLCDGVQYGYSSTLTAVPWGHAFFGCHGVCVHSLCRLVVVDKMTIYCLYFLLSVTGGEDASKCLPFLVLSLKKAKMPLGYRGHFKKNNSPS